MNIRAILLGGESIRVESWQHHPLDAILDRWQDDPTSRPALEAGFRDLLAEPDRRLRGAALHFFAQRPAADDGGHLAALATNPSALAGVVSDWYPNDGDELDVLAVALGHRAGRDPATRDAARAVALLPGRGTTSLAVTDAEWFRTNLPQLLQTDRIRQGLVGRVAMQAKVQPAAGHAEARGLARSSAKAAPTVIVELVADLASSVPDGLDAALAGLLDGRPDAHAVMASLADRLGRPRLRAALEALPWSVAQQACLDAIGA